MTHFLTALYHEFVTKDPQIQKIQKEIRKEILQQTNRDYKSYIRSMIAVSQKYNLYQKKYSSPLYRGMSLSFQEAMRFFETGSIEIKKNIIGESWSRNPLHALNFLNPSPSRPFSVLLSRSPPKLSNVLIDREFLHEKGYYRDHSNEWEIFTKQHCTVCKRRDIELISILNSRYTKFEKLGKQYFGQIKKPLEKYQQRRFAKAVLLYSPTKNKLNLVAQADDNYLTFTVGINAKELSITYLKKFLKRKPVGTFNNKN